MATNPFRKLALFALCCSLALPAAALTVSIAPAEGSDYASPPEGSGSPLEFLVSGCMGVLYDAGYIVTDSEAYRAPRAAWNPKDHTLSGAKEGLVDCIVALYVDWVPSAFSKGTLLPVAVAYCVVRVADGSIIIEGEVKGNPDSEEASSHFAEAASMVGARVAQACSKPLRTLAMGGEL
jgi:hypothetical protein